MGIDTWAVDYVLLDKNGNRLGDAVSYRDDRTNSIRDELEKNGILSFEEHYGITGIQYQKFNTCYQLLALKKENPELLEQADFMLLIPDYLNYLLTGMKAQEYTNATTTGLVNAELKTWDEELINRLELPSHIFLNISPAGTILGELSEEVQKETGMNINVILPATHDTGSAYLAVPAADENAVFLSSGTWSLLGVENRNAITSKESCQKNFTNEGGYDYRYRYLKNIMGLWMIQSIRRELTEPDGTLPSFPSLIAAAKEFREFPSVINPDDDRFLAPASMIEEVKYACADTRQAVPEQIGEVMQVVYNSLAQDYVRAIEELQTLTGRTYTALHIVGGGSQDMYLNQMTANATGLPVYAGPVEGTALGNLVAQLITTGEIETLNDARRMIKHSFEIKEVYPQ